MIRRERGRMLLPTVLLNGFQTPDEMIQAGVFGIGTNSKLNQWDGRDDVSMQLMWELDAMGHWQFRLVIKEQQGGEQSKPSLIQFSQHPGHGRGGRNAGPGRLAVGCGLGPQLLIALLRSGASRPLTAASKDSRQTTRFGDVLVLINRPQEGRVPHFSS